MTNMELLKFGATALDCLDSFSGDIVTVAYVERFQIWMEEGFEVIEMEKIRGQVGRALVKQDVIDNES